MAWTTETWIALVAAGTGVTPAAGQVLLKQDASSPGDLPTYTPGAHSNSPLTVNGNTFNVGWTNSSNAADGARDRNASVDPRLTGCHFPGISGTFFAFKVQAGSAAGKYGIRLGITDQGNNGFPAGTITISDANGTLATVTLAAQSGNQVGDASGAIFATAAAWATASGGVQIQVTSTDTSNGNGGPLLQLAFSSELPLAAISLQYLGSGGAVLAGTPADATSGTGRLNSDFLAAVAAAMTGSGFLGPFPAGHAVSVSTLTGSLSTAQAIAAAAPDTTAGSGTLTNWASVTLAAPLYSGVGSVLDANGSWSNGAPGVGATVYYDPTNMTILSNGEIVTTSQGFSAVCQWNNAGTWSYLTVIVTPGLAAYPASVSTVIGSLSAAILLGSAATDFTNAAGSLGAQIQLGGAIQAAMAATATLATAIQAAAAAVDATSASGTLSGTTNALTGAATDDSALQAVLNAQILMLAAAVDVAQAAGALATQIPLAANALSITSASAALSAGIQMQGAAAALVTGSAVLSTGINLGGAALALTNALALLLTGIQAQAQAVDTTSAAASLKTGVLLASSVSTIATALGALSTLITLAGSAQGGTSASGALSTQARLAGTASDDDVAVGALSTRTQLAGAAADSTSLTGSLGGTGGKLAANAQDASTGAADLFTSIDPDANAVDDTTATGALGVAGSDYLAPDVMLIAPPEGFWPSDGLLPFGVRYQRVGEMLLYAIDWSEWLANRWLPNAKVVPGDVVRASRGGSMQFLCTQGGYTGRREPNPWPENVGAQISDGGQVIWQAQALDGDSLADTIASAAWVAGAPVIGISNMRTLNQVETLATLDTTQALSGTDYDVLCQIVTQGKRQKVGKFRLKVR